MTAAGCSTGLTTTRRADDPAAGSATGVSAASPAARRQTLLIHLCSLFVGFFVAAELLDDEEGLDHRIRSVFREWRREKADEVSGVSVVAAFNLGALSLLGEGSAVTWARRDGQCVHPDCADNEGVDAVVVGGVFPSGHVTAPMGPGCRCLVVESAK